MRPGIRIAIDKIFTVVAGASVVCLCLVLAGVLGPMLWRGGSAVAFKGTVEFRKMQLVLFGRGDEDKIAAESRQAEIARAKIYSTIEKFKGGIDSENPHRESKTNLPSVRKRPSANKYVCRGCCGIAFCNQKYS